MFDNELLIDLSSLTSDNTKIFVFSLFGSELTQSFENSYISIALLSR